MFNEPQVFSIIMLTIFCLMFQSEYNVYVVCISNIILQVLIICPSRDSMNILLQYLKLSTDFVNVLNSKIDIHKHVIVIVYFLIHFGWSGG